MKMWRHLPENLQAYHTSGTPTLLLCLVTVYRKMSVFLSMSFVPMGTSLNGFSVFPFLNLSLSFSNKKVRICNKNDNGTQQVKISAWPGSKGLRLQLIALRVYCFSTHIQKAALFTVTSRYKALYFLCLMVLTEMTLKQKRELKWNDVVYLRVYLLQPTNILLGENFEAKLSDFGLSKIIELGETYVSSEVRGTFGYVDPDYQSNHHVNSSGDVYSFGIVLLQILSGKKVINMNLNTPLPLNKMVGKKFLP